MSGYYKAKGVITDVQGYAESLILFRRKGGGCERKREASEYILCVDFFNPF
jgi:hypothetical protein